MVQVHHLKLHKLVLLIGEQQLNRAVTEQHLIPTSRKQIQVVEKDRHEFISECNSSWDHLCTRTFVYAVKILKRI